MQSNSTCFSIQLILQQLHLNLHITPFKLKVLLKHNHSKLQTNLIQIKQKVNALSQTFCFDSDLPFKKSRGKGVVFTEKTVLMKLIATKVKQNLEIGECRINLSEFANKNSFYYQNQIKVPIDNCKDPNAYILMVFKLNRLEYNIQEQTSNLAFSIPNLPSMQSLKKRKILAVSGVIHVDDISSSNQTGKSHRSNKSNYTNKTYPEEEELVNNYHLAEKLESLYNKLESIASLTPSRINGIQVIKQQPSELIESSVISSKNMDARSKELEFKGDLKEQYQDLVKHLGRFSELNTDFRFDQILSDSESDTFYDAQPTI